LVLNKVLDFIKFFILFIKLFPSYSFISLRKTNDKRYDKHDEKRHDKRYNKRFDTRDVKRYEKRHVNVTINITINVLLFLRSRVNVKSL